MSESKFVVIDGNEVPFRQGRDHSPRRSRS